ncbi:MAG TPA: DUF3576 domain-containing protein [Stellaceae bacterium]|nr:DUF3576 domain-containing protein [Stellaceae bacterium]
MTTWRAVGVVSIALLASGCGMFSGEDPDKSSGGGSDAQTTYTTDDPYHYVDPRDYNTKTQSANDTGITTLMSSMFGGSKDTGTAPGGSNGVGVNTFLWRASLDTVRFMPLASADPFGGVIITDWYSPPDASGERFKLNIYILGRELRADGVRASVFHQKRDTGGQWVEAPVDANTATDVENAILTRARELRLSAANQ